MPEASSSAAPDVRLAPARLRIIRGMQPSAARRETAECVAKQRRAPDERADKRDRQLARLLLRTALPVNRRNVAEALAGAEARGETKAMAGGLAFRAPC